MTIPDWQLPPGVDRGLWDYLHSAEMVRGYDAQVATSPLARADTAFCERVFDRPGKLLDLGCGTGRLCVHFARKGFACVGVDLSDEMLRQAAANAGVSVEWKRANVIDLAGIADASFDYAACLFSTLGMVRGAENRAATLRSAARVLKPGGRLVMHVHNRWFRGLGWRRVAGQFARTVLGRDDAGDVTMPQAYGGAPLTLHHFTRREAERLLTAAGFRVTETRALTEAGDTGVSLPARVYGYLFAAEHTPG
jgi:SAM-dependent methyltransferase